MKNILSVIVVALVLVALVTGCEGMHRYDARLVAADSLMHDLPDSALALVQTVDPASLTREGDLAYHDLLLTQARYRCYITATSDSDINRALDYYRRHDGEREKLTRAYIYKGAVMEELGHPDSAMLYYKHAEATADEKDYANLGQINTRIADLYRRFYADEEICFEKYKKALSYYILTGNKAKQQNCYYNMAALASVSGIDNYKEYLKQATDLAIELKDSFNICQCLELKCRVKIIYDSDYETAKHIADQCIHHYRRFITNDLVLNLAFIYANKQMQDSARYFLHIAEANINGNRRAEIQKYWILSIISRNDGDTAKSNYYNGLKNKISDSIDNNTNKNHIQRIENNSNSLENNNKIKRISNLKWILAFLLTCFLIAIIIFVLYHYREVRTAKSIIHELENVILDKHERLLLQIDAKDSVIEQFVHKLVFLMHTSINASQIDSPKVFRRRVKETIGSIINDEFWNQLKTYLDKNHNNIITTISQNSKITETDLHFIELMCCSFSYIEIAIIMGYSTNYISTKRRNLARKLKIKIPLQEYLESLLDKTSIPTTNQN